jgi:hypothetical protein
MASEMKTGDVVQPESGVLPQSQPGTQAVKAEPGSSWKNNETQVLPKNRLTIVYFRFLRNAFSLKLGT